MSKKSKKKTATNKEITVSVSTRFSSKERGLIERAAELRKWSPAKLIHEATIRRATDIINASEGRELALGSLAKQVVDQLVSPTADIKAKNHDFCPEAFDDGDHPWLANEEWTTFQGEECFLGRMDGGEIELSGYRGTPLEENIREQIKIAMETCPTEFVKIILNQWQNQILGDEGYRPVINMKELENE